MGIRRKVISYLVAAALAISPFGGLTAFGASLGDLLLSKSITVGNNLTLANGVYWNTAYNEKNTENYIVYKPGATVVPKISYGNDIVGAASFSAVAAKAASEGDYVVAGMNGDYFNTTNGVAIGMTIKDGILRTSESTANPAVGFLENGTAIIGRAGLNIRADGPTLGSGIGLIHLNKTVTATSGVMLYTTDFADDNTNKAPIPTFNVVLDVLSGEAKINGAIQAAVFSTGDSAVPAAIPAGKLMLSISVGTAYPGTLTQLRSLNVGDPVTISFSANEAWNNVLHGVGGGEKLLTAGAKVVAAGGEIHPRSAIGIKADGTTIFYTVDGRLAGHSKGLTLSQLADRLLELGCVEGINMDGGGSTALHTVYPGDSATTNINRPAQGSLRNCGNYILLVNTASPTGSIANLHAYPYHVQMLAGASQTFTMKASDQNFYSVAPPSTFTYTATSGLGTFDASGIFTASGTAKSGEVSVRYNSSIAATAKVDVIAKPSSIQLIDQATGAVVTTVSSSAGSVVDLEARAIYNRMPLVSQDRNYTWTVTGNIGTIDENGLLTVGNITSGTGTVSASAGGVTATMTINVTSEGTRLETFEGDDHILKNVFTQGATVDRSTDLTKVRYGYGSGRIQYDFGAAGSRSILLPASLGFSRNFSQLSFWVYGDQSGNTLQLAFSTPEGIKEVTGTAISFTGWQQLIVPVPKGATGLSSVVLTQTGTSSGVLYLDQIMGGIGYYIDVDPPVITMSITGQSLTALVADGMDSELSPADLVVTYDGTRLPFTYDRPSKTLTSALPAPDGRMHRVAVIAADRSGNLGRSALTIPGDSMERPFQDMNGHWAADSTSYLYSLGIVNGMPTDTGLSFRPDNQITRAEFSVLMANWVGNEAAGFDQILLPFADAGSIPSWALPAAKAMYGMGIISGVEKNGSVYFNPASPISREEVMTIIGRTQQRGYTENDLVAFADNSQVSAWALPYVKTLVQQGVVSGYDNKLWPKNPVTRAQVATIITNLN
jgi:hypothetical protein